MPSKTFWQPIFDTVALTKPKLGALPLLRSTLIFGIIWK